MENHTKDSTMNVSPLNCIDLANDDLHQSVVSLKQACLDCGFFYVINHGINEEFMDDVFEQSKKFFALPLEDKMKVLRNEKHRGYTPVLDEILDPENQVNGDHKEGYYIGIEVPEDDPHWDKPFYGPNPWPDADVLPGWRETMEKYHQEALDLDLVVEMLEEESPYQGSIPLKWLPTALKLSLATVAGSSDPDNYMAFYNLRDYSGLPFRISGRVSKAIARLLALALDLDVDYFDRTEMLGKPIATMRLLRYQGISDPSKGIYACGAHSDYGMMTLLATDGIMGLQICKDKNVTPQKWEYVPPIKGAFIVNLGDMLERWSNGFFKSTMHRVLGNGQERYSIPFFVEPNHDCLVECLPTCKSESELPKYPPIKCSAYLTQRYKETHAELSIYK